MTKDNPRKARIRNPAETRAKLLQATIDLIAEKGPDALSLKEAARRANVSRGVAYLHFVDRDELMSKARSWISDQLQEGVRRFDRGASFRDRTVYTTKLVLEHPEGSQLMITAAMAGRDLDRQNPLYRLVVKMLKELRASGRVNHEVDTEILSYICHALKEIGVTQQRRDQLRNRRRRNRSRASGGLPYLLGAFDGGVGNFIDVERCNTRRLSQHEFLAPLRRFRNRRIHGRTPGLKFIQCSAPSKSVRLSLLGNADDHSAISE